MNYHYWVVLGLDTFITKSRCFIVLLKQYKYFRCSHLCDVYFLNRQCYARHFFGSRATAVRVGSCPRYCFPSSSLLFAVQWRRTLPKRRNRPQQRKMHLCSSHGPVSWAGIYCQENRLGEHFKFVPTWGGILPLISQFIPTLHECRKSVPKKKVKLSLFFWSAAKCNWFLSWPSIKFHENQASSLFVILLRQTELKTLPTSGELKSLVSGLVSCGEIETLKSWPCLTPRRVPWLN